MSNKEPEKVEIHPAFMWICANCGRDNFERLISIEKESLSDKDKEEIIEDFELEGPDELEEILSSGKSFSLAPAEVKCDYCSSSFETDPGDPNGF